MTGRTLVFSVSRRCRCSHSFSGKICLAVDWGEEKSFVGASSLPPVPLRRFSSPQSYSQTNLTWKQMGMPAMQINSQSPGTGYKDIQYMILKLVDLFYFMVLPLLQIIYSIILIHTEKFLQGAWLDSNHSTLAYRKKIAYSISIREGHCLHTVCCSTASVHKIPSGQHMGFCKFLSVW